MRVTGLEPTLSSQVIVEATIALEPGEVLDVDVGGATVHLIGGSPTTVGHEAFVRIASTTDTLLLAPTPRPTVNVLVIARERAGTFQASDEP